MKNFEMSRTEGIKNLDDGIELLKNDHTNGARVLATNAMKTLRVIASDDNSSNAKELWDQLRLAGLQLSRARPSMGAAITSAVLSALIVLRQVWEEKHEKAWVECTDSIQLQHMKHNAREILDDQIRKREHSNRHLADVFVDYLSQYPALNKGQIRILTLSSSSSLTICLEHAIRTFPTVRFTISVLESRPRMEGATFAATFMNRLIEVDGTKNVDVTVVPDSHVCTFAKTADLLLIGADRVSGDGDVSNKMGSLSAALAAKTLGDANVVVVSETDKIARPGSIEEHKDEENDAEEVYSAWPEGARKVLQFDGKAKISTRNIYFEWVPAKYIDTYITEDGILNANKIRAVSEMKAKLEDELFDQDIRRLARRI
jgi:translation initiation factor 2B subunit (eIF-2B alpha/beta/delta family)